MNLDQIATALGARVLTPVVSDKSVDVSAGYVSDLLSDVLAHGQQGGVLVTVQVHMNVIAVAVHAEMSAVIFAGGREPEQDVIERAARESIALLACRQDAFDVVGTLYQLGVRGQA